MDCADIREVLLSRALGELDQADAAEFDAHVASCDRCAALAQAGDKALAILRDWRSATDSTLEEPQIEAVVSGLAVIESARAERASARRSAREAAAPKKGGGALVIVALLLLLGGAAAAYFLLIEPPKPPRLDPLLEIAPLITSGERARDAACVMDVLLLDTMKYPNPSNRKIAAASWARTMARREGLAARCAFVRAALGADVGPAIEDGPAGPIPLRLVGDLELAGLHAAAEAECRRVIAAARDEELRRRAKLHLAAALLGQGKLGSAMKALDEVAPPAPAPAPGEEPAAPPARDFLGRLADILNARGVEVVSAREKLKTYAGSRGRGADPAGGKLAIDALELDRAAEMLAGRDPLNMAPLIRGWLQLLRGEIDAAEADFVPVTKDAQRYYRGLAHLGLAEGAFRQGRFRTGRYHLDQAGKISLQDRRRDFFFLTTFRRVTHGMVDFGRPTYVTTDLEDAPADGAMRGLVDKVIVPRVEPLVKGREAETKDWSKKESVFDGVLGKARPGTVSPRVAVPKIDFDANRAEIEPASSGTDMGDTDGLSGRGMRVSSSGASAAARLVFSEPIPEVETWVALAVKLESPGMFTIWAKEAGGEGTLFRWRTPCLPAGAWRRIAVPLGAFETEKPTGGDQSLLTKRVHSVGFSLAAGEGASAAFVLDDILVHHGLVPPEADDQPVPEAE